MKINRIRSLCWSGLLLVGVAIGMGSGTCHNVASLSDDTSGAKNTLRRAFEVPELIDWETADIPLRCDEAVEPARATGKVAADGFSPKRPAFAIDFHLPANPNGIFLGSLPITQDSLPEEPWAVELYVKLDAPNALGLDFMITDSGSELWSCGVPLAHKARQTEWHNVVLPLDWFRVLSWERVDGRLDPLHLETFMLKLYNADQSQARNGTLWLAGLRLLDARHTVPVTRQGSFALLNLGGVYNSDGVAFAANPLDGDFLAGEWQHRALPAESFPQGVAEYCGIPFQMPEVTDGKNNHIRCNGQKLANLPPNHYSALYVLATGKFGEQFGDVILEYADDVRQSVMLRISDWTNGPACGECLAIAFPHTYHEKNVEKRHSRLYVQSVQVDARRILTTIELPRNDYLKVFAATLCAGETPPSVGAMQRQSVDEVFPVFAMKTVEKLDFNEIPKGVGVFGGYLFGKEQRYRMEQPTFNGYLTMTAEADGLTRTPPVHELFWDCFNADGTARLLGAVVLPGCRGGPVNTELLDWTCIKYTCNVLQAGEPVPFSVYGSRVSPAILYETDLEAIRWQIPSQAGRPFAALEADAQPASVELSAGRSLPIPTAPWLLLWNADGVAGDSDIPIVLVFEKKPAALEVRSGKDGAICVDVTFLHAAGHVAAMPLYGMRRAPMNETQAWAKSGLPPNVLEQCREWAARLQLYPVGVEEHAEIDETARKVAVYGQFKYLALESEYAVTPDRVAMIPPVLVLAKRNGYNAESAGSLTETSCDSFWGPVLLVQGDSYAYRIPLPPYIGHMPVPVRISGNSTASAIAKEMAALIDERIPNDLANVGSASDAGGDLARLRVVAPSRIMLGEDSRRETYCAAVAKNALRPQNLKVEKEPLTGQYYLMDDRFWAKDETFDKEWAIGYTLQGLWNYAYYSNDDTFLRAYWPRICGLYAYYCLVFDWSTCSTFTLATGRGANSDGIRIAWEGMLAMARMAQRLRDETMYTDACARSAKQMMSLYASWFAPDWAAEHDYVTQQNRRIPAAQAERRFAPDTSWSETRTCNVSHPSEFFQTTHAFYIFNLAHLMFFHDMGLDRLRLKDWIYAVVPELHPAWYDGNVMCEASGRYYGSDHAMAHIILRALVFHEDPERLYDYYLRSSRDTHVITQWYTPRTAAPTALTAMLMNYAPLVAAPVGKYLVTANDYDVERRQHRIALRRVRPGEDQLVVRCWKQSVNKVLVNNAPAVFNYNAETDYLHVELEDHPGETVEICIQYGAPGANQGGRMQ